MKKGNLGSSTALIINITIKNFSPIQELGDNVVELSGQTMMAASTMIYKICHQDPSVCQSVSE